MKYFTSALKTLFFWAAIFGIILLFIKLAMYFDKWWISLFAIIFVGGARHSDDNEFPQYKANCEHCGKELDFNGTYEDVVREKRKRGWIRYKNADRFSKEPYAEDWQDWCEDCAKWLKKEFPDFYEDFFGKR